MPTVYVKELLSDPILVGRESAHLLEESLREALTHASGTHEPSGASLTIDFAGIAGMGPSFLDELVRVVKAVLPPKALESGFALRIENPPTVLSSKFEAIARSHGLHVRADPGGAWVFTFRASAP